MQFSLCLLALSLKEQQTQQKTTIGIIQEENAQGYSMVSIKFEFK